MENNLPYLLNLPPFIHRGVDVNNLGFFSKLIFIIKGKIISIITNYVNESFFCSLINLFYSKDIKIALFSNIAMNCLKTEMAVKWKNL